MRPVCPSGLSDVSGIKIFFFALDLQAAFGRLWYRDVPVFFIFSQLQILGKSLKLLHLMEKSLVFKYLVTLILSQFICVSRERNEMDLQLASQCSWIQLPDCKPVCCEQARCLKTPRHEAVLHFTGVHSEYVFVLTSVLSGILYGTES